MATAQHQSLQALQGLVGQRLDESTALGALVQHPSECRQHPGIQAVGLGQRAHGTGEVARLARVDHRHVQACSLQRTGSLELVAPRGFQHHQRRRHRQQLRTQRLDAGGVVDSLPT
ncbi:hypothetical protein D9M72_586380 [compost metagenome]